MELRHWVIGFVSIALLMGGIACGSAEVEPTAAPAGSSSRSGQDCTGTGSYGQDCTGCRSRSICAY